MMTKALNALKNNMFFAIIVLAYIILLFVRPEIGVQGIKNSGYYIKEMLMIMPVVFVLTALLDTWVPKDTITKYLGKEAKIKGKVLSFLLGSVSAGPIYAAFPFCVMLHKKGASVNNIVIILSSWAVVKIPMLLNETMFLGFKFMIIRWILTVLSIIVFAWITGKIVKDGDIPAEKFEIKDGININKEICMGCTICTRTYPELFQMEGKKAIVKDYQDVDKNLLQKVIDDCPVKAISRGF